MRVLFLLVCGIATLNSLLAAAYIWAQRRGQVALNRLLALLLLTFTVRVGKTVSVFFFAWIHPAFELAWMAVFAAGGLFFALYALRLAGAASPLRRLAPVPLVAGLTAALVYATTHVHAEGQIFLAALAVNGASIACVVPLLMAPGRGMPANRVTVRWLRALAVFVSATWLLYALPIVWRPRWLNEDLLFDAEAVGFSLSVYALVYLELRTGLLSKLHSARPAPVSAADQLLAKRVQRVMEDEKAYLDASLSLRSLADRLHVAPQQVSRVVNAQFGVGFNDYVNRFRIAEAVRILATPEGAARKIGSLAGDCGFSSSSVFYAAFKKFTGCTPSEHLKDRRLQPSGS